MTSPPDWDITAEEIEETFDQCPDCGKYAVLVNDTHTCNPTRSTGHPNEQERQQRIEADPYPGDETVVTIQQGPSTVYAYHETTGDGQPRCSLTSDHPLDHLTRADAQANGHPPCQQCQRIRHARGDSR